MVHLRNILSHVTEELIKSISKYQKDILTDNEKYHGTQYIKRDFWYSLLLISISYKIRSTKALNLALNGNFSIIRLFRPPFLLP